MKGGLPCALSRGGGNGVTPLAITGRVEWPTIRSMGRACATGHVAAWVFPPVVARIAGMEGRVARIVLSPGILAFPVTDRARTENGAAGPRRRGTDGDSLSSLPRILPAVPVGLPGTMARGKYGEAAARASRAATRTVPFHDAGRAGCVGRYRVNVCLVPRLTGPASGRAETVSGRACWSCRMRLRSRMGNDRDGGGTT